MVPLFSFIKMFLLFFFNTDSSPAQYRCDVKHPPSLLTTKFPWSRVFGLQFEMLGQDTDVHSNRSVTHETNARCANKQN